MLIVALIIFKMQARVSNFENKIFGKDLDSCILSYLIPLLNDSITN